MTATEITLHRACLKHLDELALMFDAYRVFYGQHADLARARAFLASRLELNDSVIFLAHVTQSATPLGFAQLYPSFSSVSTQRIWILNDLFVQPFARKQGVGQALLQAAKMHGEQSGACRLALTTARDNFTAQTLYEAQGWQRDDAFLQYQLNLPSLFSSIK